MTCREQCSVLIVSMEAVVVAVVVVGIHEPPPLTEELVTVDGF